MISNIIENSLGKEAKDFTRGDIVKFAGDYGINMLNFRYVGSDGRLKALSFCDQLHGTT